MTVPSCSDGMGASCQQGSAAPRSWAEDLNTYRATRGSQSFASTSAPVRTCGRTCLVPFAATQHPLFAYNDFPNQDGGCRTAQDPSITQYRYDRHGWGDTSLLKQDGYQGVLHARGQQKKNVGKAQPSPPQAADGRQGLTGVLQQTEAGGLDSWIGHPLIQPQKGKRSVAPPPDPRGRRDLFDVLHARNPGTPSDDSWIGNMLINAATGKASVPGPEQRRGRKDLSDTFTQGILQLPNRADLLKKGADPLGDAWCGHQLIDPNKGKAPVYGVSANEEALLGATFKPPFDPNWTDMKRRHTKMVATTCTDTARQVLNGTAPVDSSLEQRGKKQLPEALGSRIVPRTDLYAHMTYRPLSQQEEKAYANAWDDTRATGKRHVPVPGSVAHGKGPDMLTWHPEEALGQFVPYGKLAQEGRVTKAGIPGGTMRMSANRQGSRRATSSRF